MSTATQITELRTRMQGRFNANDVRSIRAEAKEARKKLLTTAADDNTMRQDGTLHPHVQAQYSELDEIVSACDTKLGRFEALSGSSFSSDEDSRTLVGLIGSARHDDSEGQDFGWPTNNRKGSLGEVLQRASAEQKEEFQAFAQYIRTGVMALSNLTPSGDAGALIPTFVSSTMERNFSQFSPVVDNARLFPTDTGADQVFPVLSDSESGEQIAAAALTGADGTVSGDTPPTELTGPTLKAYKISSKPVYIPRETFTDSDINIVEEVIGALLARIIRFENLRFTRGTGSGQAEGFLTACSTYEGFDTLDLDVCLDLAYSLPPLYRDRGAYMMSDTTAKYLRKLNTGISGDKRKLWADADFTKGTPPTLHGYPVIINNDMTDVASNGLYSSGTNSPIAFGDFKRFVVRQAENNRPFLYRYQVPAKDGVGVIAFRRTDSKLIVPEAIVRLAPSGS